MGSLSACIHLQTCVFPAPSFDALAALQAIHEERFGFIQLPPLPLPPYPLPVALKDRRSTRCGPSDGTLATAVIAGKAVDGNLIRELLENKLMTV